MLKGRLSVREMLFGCGLGFAVNAAGLLIWAVLMRQQVVEANVGEIAVTVTLLIACFTAAFLISARSGNAANAIGFGAVFFVLLLIGAFSQKSSGVAASAMIRNFLGGACGDFLGIFFGMRRHNRLRNIRKKKYRTTK